MYMYPLLNQAALNTVTFPEVASKEDADTEQKLTGMGLEEKCSDFQVRTAREEADFGSFFFRFFFLFLFLPISLHELPLWP